MLKVGLPLFTKTVKTIAGHSGTGLKKFVLPNNLDRLRYTPNVIGDTVQLTSKHKVWQSLTRSEVNLAELQNSGISYPAGTTKITKILGKKDDGSVTAIMIFKDKNGKNLGSVTNYPGGRRLEINIARDNAVCGTSSTEKAIEILQQFSENSRKLVTRSEYKGETLLSVDKIFSEIFRVDPDMKNAPATLWKQAFRVDKPSDIDKLYMSVVRTGKKSLVSGEKAFSQKVMQIETGQNPSRISFNSHSKMAADGEITLESLTQNGVNMNTSNPYFKTILMEPHNMAKGVYADIVKRRGLKGIEPPLLFDDTSNVFKGKYTSCLGGCHDHNDFVAINLSRNGKNSIPNTLGHECEHAFTQNADIHLAGLNDMRSENPYSRRFFDGIKKRFKPIKKGTQEYERAKIYAKESKIPEEEKFMTDGFDLRQYLLLNIEKDACKAGELEGQIFENCFKDFVNNFCLFNRSYITRR